MAILSNKADAIAKDIASDLLSGWSFAEVLGFTDEIPRKPDPSGAFQISSKMGVLPENILYVGDTNVDMQTARAAGMFPVGVSWGFRTREELLNHGATLVIDHPLELLTLLN